MSATPIAPLHYNPYRYPQKCLAVARDRYWCPSTQLTTERYPLPFPTGRCPGKGIKQPALKGCTSKYSTMHMLSPQLEHAATGWSTYR